MAGEELESIRKAFFETLKDFGEAREKVILKEYSGKREVVGACNAYILPEVCLRIYKMVPIEKALCEIDIAKRLIDYHKKAKTMTYDYYGLKKKPYYETLQEYLDEDDVLGVIYEGTSFKVDFKTYEILETVDDCWLVYLMNDWEDMEDIMEACIFAIKENERVILEAIFWYPILGMIRARVVPMKTPLNLDDVKSLISDVLRPMKEILLERIEYSKRPPEEEEEEFEEYDYED